MQDPQETTEFRQDRRRLLKTAGLLVPALVTLRAKPTLAECACSGNQMVQYGYLSYSAEAVLDGNNDPETDDNGQQVYRAVPAPENGYFKTACEAHECSDPDAQTADNYPYKNLPCN